MTAHKLIAPATGLVLIVLVGCGRLGSPAGSATTTKTDPAAAENDIKKIDLELIAISDKVCEITTEQMELVRMLYRSKARTKSAQIEVDARTADERRLVPSKIAVAEAEAERAVLDDAKYIEAQNRYAEHSRKFRDILRRRPEWGATYGSRPWARGS